MKNRDIIITSLQSWDIQLGSNCKNIALEFAKDNRVLYVNPPLDRLTALRQRASRNSLTEAKDINMKEVRENLWVLYPSNRIESISRFPVDFLFDRLNKINNRRFAKDIIRAADLLKFGNYVHFCDSDIFRSYYLKELLNPEVYIYYTRDNLLAVKYWQTQGSRIEPLHMAKADIVAANSVYLADLAGKYNRNSVFVGQGCDLSLFNAEIQRNIPEDIADIPHPIIGFAGSLNSLRLDAEIIGHIAKQKPEWNIVLVGPEDDVFKKSYLHGLKNVWLLGNKPEKQLPDYISVFDVAINPQLINEVTKGNYPRKADEYLAMGKPVVATRTSAMQHFSGYAHLVEGHDEWIEGIANELDNNAAGKATERIQFAKSHSWENNVASIYAAMDDFLNHRRHINM